MAEYQEVIKQYHKMCSWMRDNGRCQDNTCPLSFNNNGQKGDCRTFMLCFPNEAINLLNKWDKGCDN